MLTGSGCGLPVSALEGGNGGLELQLQLQVLLGGAAAGGVLGVGERPLLIQEL